MLRSMNLIQTIILFASTLLCEATPNLTDDDFMEVVRGKTVFLRFYAPWCTHSRELAPIWERLAEDFEDHDAALVADVDCEEEEDICELFEIETFPTLLWGDLSGLEEYSGDRSYQSLKAFADQHVSRPICSPFKIEACDEETAKIIEELQAKDTKQLLDISDKVDTMLEEYDENLQKKVDELAEAYEDAHDEHRDNIKKAKRESHYKFVASILDKRMQDSEEEEL